LGQRDYRILTGTAGWKHTAWGNEVFYPEDLPEDWYLSFYANEFPIVLLPNDEWLDPASCENLVDETEDQATDGFKCVLECRWVADNKIIERVEQFSAIAHVATTLVLQVNSVDITQTQLTNDVELLKEKLHVCLDVLDAPSEYEQTEIKQFCDDHAVSVCWNGKGEVVVPDDSPVWIARCSSEQKDKQIMQQLKSIITEQYKHETLSREHMIIIDGKPPKIEAVRNAMVMMELM